MTASGLVHVVAPVLALGTGGMALTAPKGLGRHVLAGRGHAGSMLVLNVAALLTYQETGGWGFFHTLAIASLVTLTAGLATFVPGRSRDAPTS